MKKIHLLAASILVSGALAMTGCSGGPKGAADGVQAMPTQVGGPDVQTNGESAKNPDLLPTSYKNLGGAKDWKVDGVHSQEEVNSAPSTAYAMPAPTDINPPSTQPPSPPASSSYVPPADPNAKPGFDNAATADAPTDQPLQLAPQKPFVVKASGFKPNTLVYAYIYFKDAKDNGEVLTNSMSDSSGHVSMYGYVPLGFKSEANYIIRIAGVNGDSQGVYSQVPLRIVK